MQKQQTKCVLFCYFALAMIKMLASYSSHMGKETSDRVNTSEVGVMMAATMRIMTIAWRRYLRMKAALMKPNLAKSHESMGISKTTPIASDMVSSVEMYDCSVIMFSTILLT